MYRPGQALHRTGSDHTKDVMNFHILTLFPDMVEAGLRTSILGRAEKAGLIRIHTVNIRDYTLEKHGHVDDTPFGGGAGMVMQCQPIYDAWQEVLRGIEKAGSCEGFGNPGDPEDALHAGTDLRGHVPKLLYTSPAGRVFDQSMARELAGEEDLIILCGHYEGVDQRILDITGAEEVSIGDYVLTGGELPAMVMVDAISRMVPGVLTNELSGEEESFSEVHPHKEFTRRIRRQVYGDLLDTAPEKSAELSLKLLEYPQYTRPINFMGHQVPSVLLSGDHARIAAWRREQSLLRTRERRPDLLR